MILPVSGQVYDEDGAFSRTCVRCNQPIGGRSFVTEYGILILANGRKVSVSGEPVHRRCPDGSQPAPACKTSTASVGRTRYEIVAPGIRYNRRTGNYLVYKSSALKKYVGCFASIDEAYAAQEAAR